MKKVTIERGRTVAFEDLPARSIALDGYCQGPDVDVENQRFSFDHHDKCLRLVTKATCEQVLDALLLGLDPTAFTIFVNDVDGDTVLSVWLLRNSKRAAEKTVRELVATVGGIDAHGPAYPAIDNALAEKFFQGVMKPELDLRRTKQYATCDLQTLLEQCVENIDALLAGKIELASKMERHFETTHCGSGWVMAKSDDFIFDLLYAEGYTRAIAYKILPDGSVNYTVGKKSELVGKFPVGPGSKVNSILYALNERETGWGGGSTIGGSPRNADGSRSRLTPDEVFEIVERVVMEG
ncbi:MAG: hypothetical protein HYV45_02805 [Candidatus Moranbacteria bacterium]|nr:hypothetical protein [Candidatus Moranbacteria bacterium]